MRVLIKNGLVIDPANSIKEKEDILIENGLVKEIKKNIKVDVDYTVDASGMIVSPGFVDLHTNFCDPGVTVREDLKSGSLSAAKGGFTHVVLGTDNKPSPSECNVIEYIKKYANIMPINIYPSAAITDDRQGIEVSDINFLYNHGAIGFFDGLKPIEDKNLLEKIMKSISSIGKVLSIYSDGAEDLDENIKLAKFLNTKLDIAYVSTFEEIEIIKKAKSEKQDIVCEVMALSIMLNDKAETKIGTNAKLIPPLASEADRKSLIKAIKDGTIDIISSNHVPIEEADKNVKFKNAAAGAIGLETLLGICGLKLIEDSVITWSDLIRLISFNPAKLFGLDKSGAGSINIGKVANITIFDPNKKWKVKADQIVSKSKNTPLLDMDLKAKVMYTICNGKLIYKSLDNEE